MLKLCRVTKVKVLFLVLVYVFKFNLFEFSAAILEKGLFIDNKSGTTHQFVAVVLSILKTYVTGVIVEGGLGGTRKIERKKDPLPLPPPLPN